MDARYTTSNKGDATMTPSELKERVQATGSHHFDRESMAFFGDKMSNYGVRETAVSTWTQENVEVWELYRKRPVKHGLAKSAYFRKDSFEAVFPKLEV
jgi:hypothetical protein